MSVANQRVPNEPSTAVPFWADFVEPMDPDVGFQASDDRTWICIPHNEFDLIVIDTMEGWPLLDD